MNTLSHHHVEEGISFAYYGDLPAGFVVPTPSSILDGTAAGYGWKQVNMSVSGRSIIDAPATRKLNKIGSFGHIDIEGNQIFFGSQVHLPGDKSEDYRTRLMNSLSSADSRVGLSEITTSGCFGQVRTETIVPNIGLALLPSKLVTRKIKHGSYGFIVNDVVPCEPNEARSSRSAKNSQWRNFVGLLLRDPSFVQDDVLYRC